jgi:hypothetical protein
MKLEEVWPALRQGSRVTNADWASMEYIVWQEGYPHGIAINENTARATGIPQGTVKKFSPYVMRHTIHSDFEPYVMSQSDMVSTLWRIIDEGEENALESALTPSIHVNRCKNPTPEGRCGCE